MSGTRDLSGLLRRWLRPGIGIKRWLAVAFAGQMLIALAVALVLEMVLGGATGSSPARALFDIVTLSFLPLEARPVVLFLAGGTLFVLGAWRVLRTLVEPFSARAEPIAEVLYQRRLRARGPRIVAIGGGTGLSILLRGLKEFTSNITAVVTVADDGGSSGKLRDELGVPPMGDIRNCIAALADAEPAMASLLQYRFPSGRGVDPGYAGHAFGNLLIAALTSVSGDFEEGVRLSNRVLAVRGSVVPVCGQPVTLHAELADGTQLDGQSRIARARGVRRVWLSPDDLRPSDEALSAIEGADLIVVGPGSVYTSLLPPLLVPGVADALRNASAARLFVCNVATQVGETEEFSVSDHLAAFDAHGLGDTIDAVLVNDNLGARQPANYPASPVRFDIAPDGWPHLQIIRGDVVADENAHHHDAHKLSAAVMSVLETRQGGRRRTFAAA